MRKFLKIIAVIALSSSMAFSMISMSACSGKGKKGDDSAKKTSAKKKSAKAPKSLPSSAVPVPTIGASGEQEAEEVEEVYSYNVIRSDGRRKRDPFTPIVINEITPVMQYDISQMGVNGVIMHGVKTANVLTPNGKSTKVRIGDSIGINGGVVIDVGLDGVRVRETYLDVRGRIQEYERVINNKPYSSK